MKEFNKPNLSLFFAGLPLIGIWMSHEYNNANKYVDCVNIVHRWLDISEDKECNNNGRKECYRKGASLLYQLLLNKSYESKITLNETKNK